MSGKLPVGLQPGSEKQGCVSGAQNTGEGDGPPLRGGRLQQTAASSLAHREAIKGKGLARGGGTKPPRYRLLCGHTSHWQEDRQALQVPGCGMGEMETGQLNREHRRRAEDPTRLGSRGDGQ